MGESRTICISDIKTGTRQLSRPFGTVGSVMLVRSSLLGLAKDSVELTSYPTLVAEGPPAHPKVGS